MNSFKSYLFLALIAPFLWANAWSVESLQYEIVDVYPHDSNAFTQGLYYEEGTLYESTGVYKESTLRRVDLKTGKVLQKRELADRYFGEGLTRFKGKLYQLTWLSNRGFIYDAESFERLGSFRYKGEGWGLTHNATHLIMSDGSAQIRFLDPENLKEVRRILVKLGNNPIVDLNELEYVDGYIYANIWFQDMIVKIDPRSGQVVGILDLSELWPGKPTTEGAVLNGIAYIEEEKTFLVTGKLWGKLFAIKVLKNQE